jgi:hypothetical protein
MSDIVRRYHYKDVFEVRRGKQGLDRMLEHCLPAQAEILLGHAGSHAQAAACGRNQCEQTISQGLNRSELHSSQTYNSHASAAAGHQSAANFL